MDDIFEVRGSAGAAYRTQDDIRDTLQSELVSPASPAAQARFTDSQTPGADLSSTSAPEPEQPGPGPALPTRAEAEPGPAFSGPTPLRSAAYRAQLTQKRRGKRGTLFRASSRIDQALDYGADDDSGNLSGRKAVRLYKSTLQEAGMATRQTASVFYHTAQFGTRAVQDVKDGALSTRDVLRGSAAFFLGESGRAVGSGARFAGRLMGDNLRDFHAGQDDLASSAPTRLKDMGYTAFRGGRSGGKIFVKILHVIRHPILAFKAVAHALLAAGSALLSALPILTLAALNVIVLSLSLKASDSALTEAWLAITRADAELAHRTAAQVGDDIDEWNYFLNGAPISRGDVRFETDCLLLLSYLDAKYQDYKLPDVAGEIERIHNALYQVTQRVYTEERPVDPPAYVPPLEEGGEPIPVTYTVMVCEVQITAISLQEYLRLQGAELLTPEQAEALAALQQAGPTSFRQELASPFPELDWTQHVTSRFGWRCDPLTGELACHRALDIAMPAGTPIACTMPGIVAAAEYHSSYGNCVSIRAANGSETLYAHMSSSCVTVGQQVPAGAVIGYVGSTGNSTGSHLHLEYKKDGVQLNPQLYLPVESADA